MNHPCCFAQKMHNGTAEDAEGAEKFTRSRRRDQVAIHFVIKYRFWSAKPTFR
jgi:hypothetical protein